MNKASDIRGIMNLVETTLVAAPIIEAFDMASFMDQVVTLAKSTIDEGGHNASQNVEIIRDVIADKFFKDASTYKEARAAGWPAHGKEFSFISAAFKSKFGKSLNDYAYEVEDQAYTRDKKSIKKQDRPIFDLLSDKIGTKITPLWAKEYLVWYKYSSTKIVVQDENSPEAVIGPVALKQLGMNMNEFVQWLTDHGIDQIKKPKPYKSSPPMYD